MAVTDIKSSVVSNKEWLEGHEKRIEALEAESKQNRERGRDPLRRYAYEWYMKHLVRHYWKDALRATEKTTLLATSSKTIGKRALVISIVSLMLGIAGLALYTVQLFLP